MQSSPSSVAEWTPERAGLPPILPFPQGYERVSGELDLSGGGRIVVDASASDRERRIARILASALMDEVQAPFAVKGAAGVDEEEDVPGVRILLARADSPLAREAAGTFTLPELAAEGKAESYRLAITPQGAALVGADDAGTFWAVQSLLELASGSPASGRVTCCRISDAPYKPIRGAHLFLPARDSIPFFKRLVAGCLARYKLNTVFLEVGAGMRLERHPEITVAWERFARADHIRGHRPVGPQGRFQDSTHSDLAGGMTLEKEEVRDLVRFCADHGIEVIPEIQSLTHVYHLLAGHPEFAELAEAEWPDAYCPSNEAVYALLFEVIEEYLDVMQPRTVHIGHDEWRAGGLCEKCRGRTGELFARDVLKIHAFLAERGVRTAMWSDHLVACHTRLPVNRRNANGTLVDLPSTEGCEKLIAREAPDILMLNWSWRVREKRDRLDLPDSDDELRELGFRWIYGNFEASAFPDWAERSAPEDVLGAEVSSWLHPDEDGLGANILDRFLWGANALWSTSWPEAPIMHAAVGVAMRRLRGRLGPGRPAPSRWSESKEFTTLELPPGSEGSLEGLPAGDVVLAGVPFRVDSSGVGVGSQRVSLPMEGLVDSVVLLGATRSAGFSFPRHKNLKEPRRTTQAFARLRVRYEDGGCLEETLRYAEHAAAISPDEARPTYFALAVPQVREGESGPHQWLYAWEWVNPRPTTPITGMELAPVGPSLPSAPTEGADPEGDPPPEYVLAAATAVRLVLDAAGA